MQNKDKHFGKTMVKQMEFLPTLIRFDLSLKSGLFNRKHHMKPDETKDRRT